jgi:hypothetical protein
MACLTSAVHDIVWSASVELHPGIHPCYRFGGGGGGRDTQTYAPGKKTTVLPIVGKYLLG